MKKMLPGECGVPVGSEHLARAFHVQALYSVQDHMESTVLLAAHGESHRDDSGRSSFSISQLFRAKSCCLLSSRL